MTGLRLTTVVAMMTESSLVNYMGACPSAQIQRGYYYIQRVITFFRRPWPVEHAFVWNFLHFDKRSVDFEILLSGEEIDSYVGTDEDDLTSNHV